MDVLETVKRRMGYEDDAHDIDVVEAIEELTRRILHYCNLSELPVELDHTLARMAVDLLCVDRVAAGLEEGPVKVTVKAGDTTVEEKPASVQVSNRSLQDAIVMNYAHDLHRYRRLPR